MAPVHQTSWVGFLTVVVLVSGYYDNNPKTTLKESIHEDYGVDTSFPIHHNTFTDKHSVHAKRYQRSMQGCYKAFSRGECDATERARIAMNFDQPRTQHNYTEIGFKKMRVPAQIWPDILKFWEENKEKEAAEDWPPGNTYVNFWESPSYMVSFENRALRGGMDMKARIWAAVKPIISEWVGGKELMETSLYGIRIYRPGSILATHVDRLPLVSSAIIQVAQDLDEPWPVEVYSHDGKAHNVTMLPGDMVLYESHSTMHGRPFPLKGRFYANIFVHFKPIDHDVINEVEMAARSKGITTTMSDGVKRLFTRQKPVEKISGHEQSNHDADEIRRHREDIEAEGARPVHEHDHEHEHEHEHEEKHEAHEERMTPEMAEAEAAEEAAEQAAKEAAEDDIHLQEKDIKDGRTALHVAAGRGDLKAVQRILKVVVEGAESDILHARDANNWQAVHEAARVGHLDVLQYLVDMGADLSAQTRGGGSVLYWARRNLNDSHPVIKYLEEAGAPDIEEIEEEGDRAVEE